MKKLLYEKHFDDNINIKKTDWYLYDEANSLINDYEIEAEIYREILDKLLSVRTREDAEEVFNYLYDPVNLFNDSDTIYILFGGAYSPDFFEDLIYLDDWKEAYLTYREDILGIGKEEPFGWRDLFLHFAEMFHFVNPIIYEEYYDICGWEDDLDISEEFLKDYRKALETLEDLGNKIMFVIDCMATISFQGIKYSYSTSNKSESVYLTIDINDYFKFIDSVDYFNIDHNRFEDEAFYENISIEEVIEKEIEEYGTKTFEVRISTHNVGVKVSYNRVDTIYYNSGDISILV